MTGRLRLCRSGVRYNRPESHARDAEPALLRRDESLADVDVVEQRTNDYGTGSVSPGSKLAQLTLGTPARFALPVMTDFESQKRSVLLPPTRVRGLLVATEMVDRLAATKPP